MKLRHGMTLDLLTHADQIVKVTDGEVTGAEIQISEIDRDYQHRNSDYRLYLTLPEIDDMISMLDKIKAHLIERGKS